MSRERAADVPYAEPVSVADRLGATLLGGVLVPLYDVLVLIRKCVVADAEALTDLHLDVWEDAYAGLIAEKTLTARRGQRLSRIVRWRQIIGCEASAELVAVDEGAGGRLLGFSSTGGGRDPGPDLPAIELMALFVRAEVYSRGVGYRLMKAAIGEDAAYLWVLEGNARAIGFYEGQGFIFDGATKVEPVGLERRMVRRPVDLAVP